MSPIATKRPLTAQEQNDLLYLIEEAKRRGIELPEVKLAIQDPKKLEWPIGPNGYFVKKDGKLYEPSDSQAKFIKCEAPFSLFYGSRGSGKSGAGSQKAIKKIEQGQSGAVINPDFENFRYSTWPEFKEWIPWRMVTPSQRHRSHDSWQPSQPFTMVFTNGARVYCKGLKDPNSARGPNLNWLWYDEGGRDETGLGWRIAIASVRIGDNPQAWVTATPKPMEHWMYKFFIKQEIPPEAMEEFRKIFGSDRILIESFHGTIEQNKTHLSPAFYASILTAYPSGFMRAQEVDGQFANEGGKLGDRGWFIGKTRKEKPEQVQKRVRFWDLAATEKKMVGVGQKKKEMNDPDESVGTLMSKRSDFWKEKEKKSDIFCIEHQVAGQWAWEQLLEAIAATARHDGPYVTIVLEEEPGSGGKNQVAAVKTHLKKFPELSSVQVIGQRARDVGDRVMAANHWFAIAAEGRIELVEGAWNEKFLAQLDGFTQILHDDRVTSVTGAITWLSPFKSWSRTPFLSL